MKKVLRFRKSLKALLLLAVLSICAPNIMAQNILKPGLVKFRYIQLYDDSRFLSQQALGRIGLNADAESAGEFQVDIVGIGRHLIALDCEKINSYTTKGRYLFSNANSDMGLYLETPPSEEALANSYFGGDWRSEGYLTSVEAIRVNNYLYVTDDQQIDDISKLDELAEAGSVKKITLHKANNFIFLLTQTKEGQNYLQESVIMTSEIGGEIAIDDFSERAVIRGKTISSTRSSTFIVEQLQKDNSQAELKTGFTKFQYWSQFSINDRYLSGKQYPDTFIYVNNTSNANIFHIDAVGEGRYLMALHYEEKDGYSKGRFMYNSCVNPVMRFGWAAASPLPDEVLENCYYENSYGDEISTVAAIRIGDALYVTPEMPASMSILNEMVQSGSVKKIDLTKTNNFMFSFNHIEDDPYDIYPDDAVGISSETIGKIAIEDNTGRAALVLERDAATRPSLFFIEPQQKENQNDEKIIVTPSVPNGNNGIIDLSLDIPVDKSITGEFTITMPDGFNLDKAKTVLAQELKNNHTLEISDKAKGVWTLKITPATNARNSSENNSRKIADIAYTVENSIVTGNYDITISDLEFVLNDNTTIIDDDIKVNVSYSTVGNSYVENTAKVTLLNNTLTINSPNSERVDVYSMSGMLIFSKQKPEGEVKYQINGFSNGVIVVKGSSGWIEKIAKM